MIDDVAGWHIGDAVTGDRVTRDRVTDGRRILDSSGVGAGPDPSRSGARIDGAISGYGLRRAQVLDNRDPAGESRVLVSMPDLADGVWAAPCVSPWAEHAARELIVFLDLAGERSHAQRELARIAIDGFRATVDGIGSATGVPPEVEQIVTGLGAAIGQVATALDQVVEWIDEFVPAHPEFLEQSREGRPDRAFSYQTILPEVDRTVWIAYEDGDPARPVWLGYADVESWPGTGPDQPPPPEPGSDEDTDPSEHDPDA